MTTSDLIHAIFTFLIVTLFVSNLYFQCSARLDEVFLEDIIECRVDFLSDVLNEERPAEGQAVFQVSAEILVVE